MELFGTKKVAIFLYFKNIASSIVIYTYNNIVYYVMLILN